MIGESSSSSLYIKTCPACGGEVPRAARQCTFCGYPFSEEAGKTAHIAGRGEALRGVAVGLALASALLSVGLLAGVLLPIFGVALHLFYAALTLLLVSLLAARQRYEMPTFWQNLSTLAIGALPLLGSIYVLYYAGRRLSRFPTLRRSLYGVLLVSSALLIAMHPQEVQRVVHLPQWSWPAIALSPLRDAEATSTLLPSPTPHVTQTQSTPSMPPTATPMPAQSTPTATSPLASCLRWDAVTLDRVGEYLCVYGDYLRTYVKEDGVYVLAFSDQPGSFQIWSFPKSFEAYLANISSTCVVVQGWLQTSGVRPIIILKTTDTLVACP